MTITKELLQTIYKRTQEYYISKFWKNPDRIELQEDGDLSAVYIPYRCGHGEEDYETVTAENLTEDLDDIAKKRAEQKEREHKEEQARQKQQEKLRKQKELRERKELYLKLKQEFET